jgi:vacuolar protein sorting-associated protein 45
MKALLLDSATTQAVSAVYSQTQILEHEVYLVELLGKRHEPMMHLKATIFIQPTAANIDLLAAELKDPKFAEYHIFFSNILPPDLLTRLGRADEFEVVKQVQEYYADFLAVNEDFFHLGIENSLMLSSRTRTLETSLLFERNLNGLLSVFLALKKRPSQIRYQAASELARRMATEVLTQIERDEAFDFRRQEGPMLIVLDRRDDPVTPLLTQWTYQAMVHELLGINNNRVMLKGDPKKGLDEVVLSSSDDTFFRDNRNANFGDLGTSIKQLLDEYQRKSKLNDNISTVEDMQAFIERYPAFRSQALNVSKHVALMSELSRLVDKCKLLDISQLEQGIVCSSDHGPHYRELFEKLSSPLIQPADKLRLALLHILKYESYNEIGQIKAKLNEQGISSSKSALIDAALEYAGETKRAPGLFSSGGLMSRLEQTFSTVKGIDNVYTQHQPLLSVVLDAFAKGKLKDSAYPAVNSGGSSRPVELFVYMIGGVTFEEAFRVSEFNSSNPGIRVFLGGSCLQNSASFLKEIQKYFDVR